MKMIELEFDGGQPPIDGYAPGGFRVRGRFIEGSILVTPEGVASWPASVLSALDAAAAAEGLKTVGAVDLAVLGVGEHAAHAPAAFRAPFDAAVIGLEAMPTPAACRTYNVLLSEGRRVAAMLIAL